MWRMKKFAVVSPTTNASHKVPTLIIFHVHTISHDNLMRSSNKFFRKCVAAAAAAEVAAVEECEKS